MSRRTLRSGTPSESWPPAACRRRSGDPMKLNAERHRGHWPPLAGTPRGCTESWDKECRRDPYGGGVDVMRAWCQARAEKYAKAVFDGEATRRRLFRAVWNFRFGRDLWLRSQTCRAYCFASCLSRICSARPTTGHARFVSAGSDDNAANIAHITVRVASFGMECSHTIHSVRNVLTL
jgi:hypothetical protein